eukprot:TRINITY_DN2907_c0_g1_i1.p1 TRINITY_DN2907_c0_g1~~TRINITY_DN2907_c0_g1_i1.p1  ORF type:complete len:102 (-),score=21.70 TRINITY_DN2907_c0_g1_i1:23-328(-)
MSLTQKHLLLYLSILKVHQKKLPQAMRLTGNEYIRAEFKAHKKATPEQLQIFTREWTMYLQHLQASEDVGLDLEEDVRDELSNAQKQKLNELAREIYNKNQ